MKSIFALTFLVFFNFSTSQATTSDHPLFGLWKTQDQRAKIEISPCKHSPSEVCGTIVKLREPLDPQTNQEKTDHLNPDPSLKGRKLLGLQNLSDFKADPNTPNHWTDGKIYSPREGETYSCEMTLINTNTLEVRGYVGISLFGKTQTWTRTTLDEKLIAVEESN